MAHRERKRDREQAAERVGKMQAACGTHHVLGVAGQQRHCRQLQLAMHTNAVPCSLYDVMACATCDGCASSRAPKSMLRIFSCLLPWRRRLMRRAAVAAAATLSRRLCSFCAFFFFGWVFCCVQISKINICRKCFAYQIICENNLQVAAARLRELKIFCSGNSS